MARSHTPTSPHTPPPPARAGRSKAKLELVLLSVYIKNHRDDAKPLLEEPISVHKRGGEQGEDSDQYLCQFKNPENKAFRELIREQYGKDSLGKDGCFPSFGFSVKQRADLSWEHEARGEWCLNNYYDFVEV